MLKTNKTDHDTTTFFLQFATRIIWRYAMSPIDAVTNKLRQTFFSRFSVFRNTSSAVSSFSTGRFSILKQTHLSYCSKSSFPFSSVVMHFWSGVNAESNSSFCFFKASASAKTSTSNLINNLISLAIPP